LRKAIECYDSNRFEDLYIPDDNSKISDLIKEHQANEYPITGEITILISRDQSVKIGITNSEYTEDIFAEYLLHEFL
jgi:hypothetical protein